MNLKINLICSLFLTLSLSSSYGKENNNEKQGFKRSPDELNRQDENEATLKRPRLADSSIEAPNLPIVHPTHEKGPRALLKEQIEDLKKQGKNLEILHTFELILQDDLVLAKNKVDSLAQQGEPIMRFLQNIPSLFKSRNTPDMTIRENSLSFLSYLPEEIKGEIMKWLEPQDKAALSCVNKDWNKFIRPRFIKPPVSYDSWRTINLYNPGSFNFTPEWNKQYYLSINTPQSLFNKDMQRLLDDFNHYQTILHKLLFLKNNICKIHIGPNMYIESLDVVRLLNKYTMLSAVVVDETNDVSALLNFLKTNKTLISLELANIEIDDENAQTLEEALKENKTLTSLGLYYSKLEASVAQALREVLKENKTLTSLKLHGDQIGASVPQALGEALKVNTTLTYLDLGFNKIGEAGRKTLGEALKVNTTLTSLVIGNSWIGPDGAKSLGEGLKENRGLTYLYLHNNGIGHSGAYALGEALTVNTTLTSLDVSRNFIENTGAQAIMEALKKNITLTALELSRNFIAPDMQKILQENLRDHPSLKTFYL